MTEPLPNRRDVVARLLRDRGRMLVVPGLGGTTWDVAAAGLVAQEAGAQVSFVDSTGAESIWPWDIEHPKSKRTLVAWAPGVEDPRLGAT